MFLTIQTLNTLYDYGELINKANQLLYMQCWAMKCLPTYAYYISLFQRNRACSSLTIQSQAVTIEVSTVQVLKMRTNPWQVHKVKYLPPTNWTFAHTGFHNGQVSYLSTKVLELQNLSIRDFFLNSLLPWKVLTLHWPHKRHPDLQLWSLVYRLRYANC